MLTMPARIAPLVLAISLGISLAAPGFAAGENQSSPRRSVQQQDEDLLTRNLFQALLGEIALRRGDPKLAVDVWSDLARRSNDPRIVEHATEIAGGAQDYKRAFELAQRWLQLEPESLKARQISATLLLLTRRYEEVPQLFAGILAQDKENLPGNLMHLNTLASRMSDKQAAQKLIEQLVAPYLEFPEAHYALAQAAVAADDRQRAGDEVATALKLRPDWEVAALFRAQLQVKTSADLAIRDLEAFVGSYPSAASARLILARLLTSAQRLPEARKHYDILLQKDPDNGEIIFPTAVIALQQGELPLGRRLLERLLNLEFANKTMVHYLLGQLDQEDKQLDSALAHYREVLSGEQYLAARSRSAQILAQQGRMDEARDILHNTLSENATQRSQLLLTEAQLLREAEQNEAAYQLLNKALQEFPDDADLLYDAALTAERIGKPELLEKYLARVISLQPNHPHALNALGYSFAERNIRLDEAYSLISKALTITPNDPYIIDSLGWVLYRQGKLEESLQILQKAYSLKQDAEIAAHLGEVLWSLGRQAEARKLVSEALKRNPASAPLKATASKIQP